MPPAITAVVEPSEYPVAVASDASEPSTPPAGVSASTGAPVTGFETGPRVRDEAIAAEGEGVRTEGGVGSIEAELVGPDVGSSAAREGAGVVGEPKILVCIAWRRARAEGASRAGRTHTRGHKATDATRRTP